MKQTPYYINPVDSSITRKPWSPKPENKNNYTPKNKGYAQSKNSQHEPSFYDKLSQTMDEIYNVHATIPEHLVMTENGALAHKSSGSKLLDLHFAVSTLRPNAEGVHDAETTKKITNMFRAAFNEYPKMAMKWLFYARDVREGLGERNLFKVCIIDLANNGHARMVNMLVPHMAEYGRWDDMLCLLDTKCRGCVLKTIKAQWDADIADMAAQKSISLLGKWLPSEQASNEVAKKNAHVIAGYLKLTPRQYRKSLSALRAYIDVIERKMSSDNWQAIDYETVPSKANLKYKNAFLKHDEERRRAYLAALEHGEAKINSSVAYPYDIVHKYMSNDILGWNRAELLPYDATLEGMWKSLPNMIGDAVDASSTIVVADGSGSMLSEVSNSSNVTCLEVANALAIYFAQYLKGGFKGKYITFSSKPQLVDVGYDSLHENLASALKHDECANTNITATFMLLLQTAIDFHMSQEDLPKRIVVISDMAFDQEVIKPYPYNKSYWPTLFDNISEKFEQYGYKMPRLVFWNVCGTGRYNQGVPMKENEAGVTLVSGFSVNVCKMVMTDKLDPYEALVETLNVKRYDIVGEVVDKIISTTGPEAQKARQEAWAKKKAEEKAERAKFKGKKGKARKAKMLRKQEKLNKDNKSKQSNKGNKDNKSKRK